MVAQFWNDCQVYCKKGYVLEEKLKILKAHLQLWNRDVFGSLDLNINNLLGGIVDDLPKLKEVLVSFWENPHLKENMIKQKYRTRWIRERDANTKFFHACLKSGSEAGSQKIF